MQIEVVTGTDLALGDLFSGHRLLDAGSGEEQARKTSATATDGERPVWKPGNREGDGQQEAMPEKKRD